MARRSSGSQKYPIATLAVYGPDNTRATKLVAAVLTGPSSIDAEAMESWSVEDGDVRNDPAVADHLAAWLKQHGVKETATAGRIIGCPHQEGIDYPMGRACPQCPFWETIDRFTHQPVAPPVATMTADDVLRELSLVHSKPPVEALVSVDAHRAALTGPLLAALERGLERGADAPEDEAQLFSHALYLFAKWREVRAYPLVLRWLSLPIEATDVLTGDVLTQDGARILAAVCDGNLGPIRELVLEPAATEFSRSVGIGSLALLAAWKEVDRQTIVSELQWLAREGLEREPGYAWSTLAVYCADIEALEVFSELRRACGEGLIDPIDVAPSDLDAVEAAPRGTAIAALREGEPPIDDVAEATAWWGCYSDDERAERWLSDGSEPYQAPPKVGRNEPCPCGSGKKYKKCCGA